jgi:glycosidase
VGGRAGLATARAALAAQGMALILDFVPNHVAPDHPWTESNPEYFVQGTELELARSPEEYLAVNGNVYARGRDPYFAPWQDVVQLNAFAPGLRRQMIATLLEIAEQCDGVRCDMAMLMNTEIFAKTWGERAGAQPETEYWAELFAPLKHAHPHFTWIAEVYWDMEWKMQQLGFDYCYDKRLYDRLVVADLGAPGTVESIDGHLHADLAYQQGLVRFVENHDEPRAAAAFPPERLRAATVAVSTQPGARLFHEGQLEGRRTRVNVFLGRRPQETPDQALLAWSRHLLAALQTPVFHSGAWRLCQVQPAGTVIAWCWRHAESHALALIAVNLGNAPARAKVTVNLRAGNDGWLLSDALGNAGEPVQASSEMLANEGVVLDLAPWEARLLHS